MGARSPGWGRRSPSPPWNRQPITAGSARLRPGVAWAANADRPRPHIRIVRRDVPHGQLARLWPPRAPGGDPHFGSLRTPNRGSRSARHHPDTRIVVRQPAHAAEWQPDAGLRRHRLPVQETEARDILNASLASARPARAAQDPREFGVASHRAEVLTPRGRRPGVAQQGRSNAEIASPSGWRG